MSLRYTLTQGATPDAVESAMDRVVLVGQRGDTYTLGKVPLGAGGQAEVWPAQRADGSWVAIKLAWPSPGPRRAVGEEAVLLQALSDAGATCTVTCLDTIEGERTGFVMPLYAGDVDTHVAELIRAGGNAHPLEAVLGVAAELARALRALHRVELPGVSGHIVHRDIKPDNLLVDRDGRLIIADLGGHLVVEGKGSLDLGVFGTPMWAPLDQMLPGQLEPNPTWDTYAACVLLFWWITGGRPDYQSDPGPMLTPAGREVWDTLSAAARAAPDAQRAALQHLERVSSGKRAADLVDVKGHAAIQEADRAGVAAGVQRLADVSTYGFEALDEASRGLGELFARGLSPLSHPSPPNRFWNAADLADEIELIRKRLVTAREARVATHSARVERAALTRKVLQLESRQTRRGPMLMLVAGLLVVALGGAGLGMIGLFWGFRADDPGETSATPATAAAAEPETASGLVRIEASGDSPNFWIQRTEVSNRDYRLCQDEGVCEPPVGAHENPSLYQDLDLDALPVVGVTHAQAHTWCAWKGGRLPSAAEWDRAARGPRLDRAWPWGDEPADCSRANLQGCAGAAMDVTSLTVGASLEGVHHLIGNVWEWTADEHRVVKRKLFKKTVEDHRVLRGGAWDTRASELTETTHVDPALTAPTWGFRCVFERG